MSSRFFRLAAAGSVILLGLARPLQTAPAPPPAAKQPVAESLSDALTPQSWKFVEQSIDRALVWLASRQERDGSFEGPPAAQPAATSLAIMAYLSKGHLPGEGPYGAHLDKAIDFVLKCQRADGLCSYADPGASTSTSGPSKTGSYNHGIAGLMLTEVYGMTDSARAAKLKPAIVKALGFTRRLQTRPKPYPEDEGGWRYLHQPNLGSADSDLSVTAWQVMFLRSEKMRSSMCPGNSSMTPPPTFMGVGMIVREFSTTPASVVAVVGAGE